VKILLTGAEGFVGRRLMARLRGDGDEIFGFDRDLDVSDTAQVRSAVSELQPEAIAHLAAVSFVPDSVREPQLAFRVNYLGTRSVLEAMAHAAPGARVLVVSSGAVYGNAPAHSAPFDESSPLRPDSPYAWTKAAADRLAGVWGARGFDVVRVRPFNHTGVGRPDQFAESAFARQLAEIRLERRAPRLAVGNLEAVRDFLDVDDVIDAYARLLHGRGRAGLYNVASGVGRSLQQVLDILMGHAGLAGDVSVEVDRERWRETDRMVGDASRLREATGWVPQRAIEDTLGGLFDDWLTELGRVA